MNAKYSIARTARTAEPIEPRVYEVHEFINLKPGEDYVEVRHSRTVFHPGGRVSQECLSVEPLLEVMIRAFHGSVYRSAGVLYGFFAEPEQARECARTIGRYHDKEVNVCGTQITIAI